jgi:lipopolysaccharide/colanic/teichoic acid biosynthesis glycosyltransferase
MSILDRWIYKHDVLGKGASRFREYKIKTMYDGSDELFVSLVHSNGRGRFGKVNGDHRIIPSRKWLRKWQIDEAPHKS